MRSLALLPLALLAACQTTGTPRAGTAAAPSTDTMRRVVERLASDEFEGRAPGTAGEEKTLQLLVSEFTRIGLQPGNQGSFFQDVPLVEITTSQTTPMRFSGGAAPVSAAYGPEMVVATYRTGTTRADVKDSPVVFVGYGIVAPEKGWNDYAGLDVRGKTVVILVNDPDYETAANTGTFNGRAMTYYGRWTYKFEEAARQGAAAAIIVHDTIPAAYGWNVVQSSWTGPQQVAASADDNAGQSVAIGWIGNAKAAELMRAAGQDLAALTAAAKRPGFRAVDLGVRMSVGFDVATRRHMSRNVVALLPGTSRADEYVLYTAHWDHLGRCEKAADGDDICNGAVDNASGTAALVALAEANAKAGRTPRSQMFVALTAEESGLLGAAYYAANPVVPLARTVAGVNIDAMSVAGPARNVVVVGRGKSDLDAYLDRALRPAGRVAEDEPTPEKGFYYRSDHFELAKRGVPMLYFEGGDDLLAGGRAAGKAAAAAYERDRYHGPKDELDASWNWDGVRADLDAYYRVGRELATTTAWPNWVAGDEFRAARDATAAERRR